MSAKMMLFFLVIFCYVDALRGGGGDMRFAFFRIFCIFFRIFWAGPLV